MSQDKPLSPGERIELVQNDRARRYGQIAIAIFLIAFAIGFLSWYVLMKADGAFLNYMAVGILALVFAGIGAAFAIFGLGRTVGSNSNANNDSISAILAIIHEMTKPGNSGPGNVIPDEDPELDEPGTLHEELPEEVPPSRTES